MSLIQLLHRQRVKDYPPQPHDPARKKCRRTQQAVQCSPQAANGLRPFSLTAAQFEKTAAQAAFLPYNEYIKS